MAFANDPTHNEQRHTTVAGQIFKAQRTASRRLAVQFLFSLDIHAAARKAQEQELASFPARIEAAKRQMQIAASTPPPVDEEGNPVFVAQPTVPLLEQLDTQREALREFLETERQEPSFPSEESQENFFTLAEEATNEDLAADEETDTSAQSGLQAAHRVLRKGWTRARKLVAFAVEHQTEIDQYISRAAQNWTLQRMACVDRNILRAAIAELLLDPPPTPAIVLNEAIELAKQFGQNDSGKFVNGVLDHVRKELEMRPLVIGSSQKPSEP